MNEISYCRLNGDARELLQRERQERRLFLDFLAVLQDILATKSDALEPPLFTPAEQEVKADKLCESLTDKAGLQKMARANLEGVFAVQGGDVAQFLSDLLDEYNQIRVVSQDTGRYAFY
jgi:hypothetical protein